MSTTAVRVPSPHARPVYIRLTRGERGQLAGSVIGPIPLHVAELYVNRGAAEFIEDESPTAKRINNAPRNKSFA